MQMYMSDVFTLSCNLAGICGLSLPCGFADGLPIGLQIQGPAFKEESVIRVAYAYEQATPWHRQHPTVDVDE
jgi:aspartyl-tRNA(Asn)/glutamyl-tRNA(Gln) amidotransferase subunit A